MLNFPNGNSISTIWSSGSYTENHDYDVLKEDGSIDFERTYKEFNPGSMNAEVMVSCGEELNRALQDKFDGAGGSVIGRLYIMDWLEVVNRVANEITLKK